MSARAVRKRALRASPAQRQADLSAVYDLFSLLCGFAPLAVRQGRAPASGYDKTKGPKLAFARAKERSP